MLIGAAPYRYDMIDFGKLPSSVHLGYTHGVVVDGDDNVYVFNQSERAVIQFDRHGNFQRSWGGEFSRGAHGMFLDREGPEEFFYLTDYDMPAVVKTTIHGAVQWQLGVPPRPDLYESSADFKPTDAAVSPDGDVYVFDGYGRSYVHVYDRRGKYLLSFGGRGSGEGQLNTPHAGWIDTRKAEPELYVADRGNNRIQVFTLEGKFKRIISGPEIKQPCDFYQFGDDLYVPDLQARLVVLDINDHVTAVLGDNPEAPKTPGWPDIPGKLSDGKFNSCHACCVDSRGDVYVVEWISTGRVLKLVRQA